MKVGEEGKGGGGRRTRAGNAIIANAIKGRIKYSKLQRLIHGALTGRERKRRQGGYEQDARRRWRRAGGRKRSCSQSHSHSPSRSYLTRRHRHTHSHSLSLSHSCPLVCLSLPLPLSLTHTNEKRNEHRKTRI